MSVWHSLSHVRFSSCFPDQGFELERHVYHVVLEVFLKLGHWQDALGVMDDMAAQVRLAARHAMIPPQPPAALGINRQSSGGSQRIPLH